MAKDPGSIDGIERMEKSIYARNYPNQITPRAPLSQEHFDVNDDWKDKKNWDDDTDPNANIPPGSVFKKILIGSMVFFFLCAGIAAFAFWRGINVVSADKVDVTFVGPTAVNAGDSTSVTVNIANNNSTPLTNLVLYISYPDGTKSALNISSDLLHETDTIGAIPAGGSAQKDLTFVLFGAAPSLKDIDVKLQYGIPNSNQVFTKDKVYEAQIVSSPLSLSADYPSSVSSGGNATFTLTVVSNSSSLLPNMLLEADYPFGFSFQSASPTPTLGQSLWSLPAMKPGDKKVFTITGEMDGEEGDVRIMRFSVGAASSSNPRLISTTYVTASDPVTVHKAPLAVTADFGVDNQPMVTLAPGKDEPGSITITNNLPVQVVDSQISR